MELLSELTLSQILMHVGQIVISIIFIVLISRVAIKILCISIDRLFARTIERKPRSKTLAALMKNILGYVVTFVALVMILERLGINTASLLAAAGIAGVAIGFGAQNLVKDIVTGFFLLLENQYVIGDYVTVSGLSGIVEEIGLRVTKIRDFGGQLHIIPNGSIDQVTNHMGNSMRVLVDVDIAYEADVTKAIQVLEDLFVRLADEMEDIIEGPKVLGLRDLGDSGVTIGTWAKAKPMTQWSSEREMRKAIKITFDEHGIEIPYPRRYLVFDEKSFGQEKKTQGERPERMV